MKSVFREPNGKKVICGKRRLDANNTDEVSLTITEIINHPEYDGSTFANDIAVIKVAQSGFCALGKVYPACIPNINVS